MPSAFEFMEIGEIVELPNGGHLPSRAVVLCYGEDLHGSYIEMTIVLDDSRRVGVERVEVVAGPPGAMTPAALSAVNWKQVVEGVVQWAGWAAEAQLQRPRKGRYERPLTFQEENESRDAVLTHFRRRKIDDELLREVAQIVKANPARWNRAVMDHFVTGQRNATRWILAARKAGFLPKSTD